MLEESIIKKLESLRSRSIEIHEALAKEGATDNMPHFTQLNKEYAEITPIVDLFKSLQNIESELTGAKELLDSGDSELIELAKIEVNANQDKIVELEKACLKKIERKMQIEADQIIAKKIEESIDLGEFEEPTQPGKRGEALEFDAESLKGLRSPKK